MSQTPSIATVSLKALIVVARLNLLRNGQIIGPRLALSIMEYPLARNQYINNSPGIFSCIRPGVNTCAASICTDINSPKIFLCIGPRDVRIQALCQYRGQGQSANTYFENNSSIIFSCIRTSANTGSTCIRAKINSSRFFSCRYRFCVMEYFCMSLVTRPK